MRNSRRVAGYKEECIVPTSQILLIVGAGLFLVLYLIRRRTRLKKEM